jgi:hypothetical protein
MEIYANQDNNDDAWRQIVIMEEIEECPSRLCEGVSTTEAILQNYFIDRIEVKKIAERYYKSRQYIHYIIRKHKIRMAEIIKKSVENPH